MFEKYTNIYSTLDLEKFFAGFVKNTYCLSVKKCDEQTAKLLLEHL